MAEPKRICPGCGEPMQTFFAKEVQLDRCGRCGGLWFDWGELEAVVGRKLGPERLEGETARRCAFCRITLAPALLPGGVPVETCTACRGMYLDAGELNELGGEEPPAPDGAEFAEPDAPIAAFRAAEAPAPAARPMPRPELGTPDFSAEPKFELAELAEEERQKAERRARAEREAALQPLRAFDSFACVTCGKRFAFREGNAVRAGLACRSCAPQPQRPPSGGTARLRLENLVDVLSEQFYRRRHWHWFW